MVFEIALFGIALCGADASGPPPARGTRAHYRVLTAQPHTPPPFEAVDVIYGPRAPDGGTVWWQLEAREKDDAKRPPLFQLRALTSGDPLTSDARALRFHRYILRIPGTGQGLEYRDAHTAGALLPGWRDFVEHFVPHRARAGRSREGVPQTCRYLGHVLTLRGLEHGVPWPPWEGVTRLDLDPELLVGTGRSFKDAEGHRLPQKPKRRDYTYVPFTETDYRTMIDAGINLFTVRPRQEKWVRAEPVFYLRGAGGEPALRYPADLYRSNYLGAVMFMDEPSIIMVGDAWIHDTLRYFTDAAELIRLRVAARYRASGSYGAFRLEKALAERGVNFGAMRLEQWDYPSWETFFETAHYQLAGGLAGIVHEGRYRLAPFDAAVARFRGEAKRHTPDELLRYHFAFLRGAARAFGKSWGTSIYGQCDPAIAPVAVTLAYDMGARYIWFWTSDHDHHLPWPEQLALARRLRDHARAHPRPSIRGRRPVLDLAIVIPHGSFLSLRNLWWVRELDPRGNNDAARRYRRLMRRALAAVEEAFARGEDFDIAVDDGRPIEGYRRIARVTGDA